MINTNDAIAGNYIHYVGDDKDDGMEHDDEGRNNEDSHMTNDNEDFDEDYVNGGREPLEESEEVFEETIERDPKLSFQFNGTVDVMDILTSI